MISSFQQLGGEYMRVIIRTTSNPLTAFFIAMLVTAMLQSSSTTTALTVAMVGSGSLTLQGAVPVIMGANVGTTITCIIISLGFINKKKELKRAVSAGTYHFFFNLLTVVILFPLEHYYGFLSKSSEWLAHKLVSADTTSPTSSNAPLKSGLDPFVNYLIEIVPAAVVMICAFILLLSSILLFRKFISDLLNAKSPQAFSRFFFQNNWKSFLWGTLTTAAIRSSTITTSVVVPIVAKKIVNFRMATPFLMGANVGTTVTAFIAAILYSDSVNALSIAITHFLFNVIGVLLFFPVSALREIPIRLSLMLGKATVDNRAVGFVFLLLTFFFIPFLVIYISEGT